jgi:purine-cytosine permease-like protein
MRKTNINMDTAPSHRIAMILLGIAVTPVLLSSSSLGNKLSSSTLITVVVIGGLILTVLAAITMCVGEKARLPTYGIVKYPFGEKGAVAINVLLAVSLFGWILADDQADLPRPGLLPEFCDRPGRGGRLGLE